MLDAFDKSILDIDREVVMRAVLLSAITVIALVGCSSRSARPVEGAVQESVASAVASAASDSTDGLRSGELFDALARMDSELFDASFASCDAATANAIFSDDVEFYHDQRGGFGDPWTNARSAVRMLASSRVAHPNCFTPGRHGSNLGTLHEDHCLDAGCRAHSGCLAGVHDA